MEKAIPSKKPAQVLKKPAWSTKMEGVAKFDESKCHWNFGPFSIAPKGIFSSAARAWLMQSRQLRHEHRGHSIRRQAT